MNIILRYKRLSGWNKFAFWGSVASIIAIILWIRDCQSDRMREEDFLPAREAVVTSMFQCYKSIIVAAEYVIAPSRVSEKVHLSPHQKFLICKWNLDPVKYNLEKLENIVLRNNVALSPQLINSVSAFLDNAKRLYKHLTFFSQLYDPQMSNWDFVSTAPLAQLLNLETIHNELKKQYSNITIENNLKSTEELEIIWKDVDKNNDRICLNVKQYKWEKGRMPMVFDTKDLEQLDAPNAYVYDLNE